MKRLVFVSLLLLPCLVRAQTVTKPVAQSTTAAIGLGNIHHKVSTNNAQAQHYFDQGLALVYAFNHDEAAKAFQQAAKLDPKLAMAHWGIALTQGSNYNLPSIPEREKQASEAIAKAQELAPGASEIDQAYIRALARRYSADPKDDLKQLAISYHEAMADLSRRYPDDLDAATLYAESGMNLRPWALWTVDGKPEPGTEEIVRTLESVMKRDPNHTGANHYYIHAVEASNNPERALPSAKRLEKLSPAAGHLVHMPSHVYIRTGDHESAAHSNEMAAAADRAYITRNHVHGIYSMMYYSHNLHFLASAYSMGGDFARAKRASELLLAHVAPDLKMMPPLQMFLPTKEYVLVRFGKWDDILALPEPKDDSLLHTAIWHYARGMAYAATGDQPKAHQEHTGLSDALKKAPADAMVDKNSLQTVLSIADNVLASRIARMEKDTNAAALHLQKAVSLQDKLNYIEPPEWYYPVRESLGGMLFSDKKMAEAEQAFRADLERNPRNGRSLFGLMQSLKAQGKIEDAALVQEQFNAAWKNADTKLSIAEF